MATHVNEEGRRLKCSAKISCPHRTNSHYPDVLVNCEKEGEPEKSDKVLAKMAEFKSAGFSEFAISRYFDDFYNFDEEGEYADSFNLFDNSEEEQLEIVNREHPDSLHVAMLRDSRFYRVRVAASDKYGYEIDVAKERFNREIKGRRFLLTGDNPGEILESGYGYSAGNSASADLGGVELKVHAEGSRRRGPVTLSNIGIEGAEAIKESPFVNFKNGSKSYCRRLKMNDWVDMGGGYKVALYPDDDSTKLSDEEKKIRLLVARNDKIMAGYEDCYWSYSSLFRRVESKLESVLVARYSKETSGGQTYVTFTKCQTGGFSKERFIDELKNGNIEIHLKVVKGRDSEGNEKIQVKSNFSCRERVLFRESD